MPDSDLEVHVVRKDGFEEIVAGQTYTAMCGKVWQPTLTKWSDLEKLNTCGLCVDALLDAGLSFSDLDVKY